MVTGQQDGLSFWEHARQENWFGRYPLLCPPVKVANYSTVSGETALLLVVTMVVGGCVVMSWTKWKALRAFPDIDNLNENRTPTGASPYCGQVTRGDEFGSNYETRGAVV